MEITKEQMQSKIISMETELKELHRIVGTIGERKTVEDLHTWEEICKHIGRDPNKLPDVSLYDEKHRKHAIADFKLTICAEVRNGGWVPDYSNNNQQKWYNWFRFDASRGCFVFYVTFTTYEHASTTVGARFCFKTKTNAQSFGKDFEPLYNELLLLKN